MTFYPFGVIFPPASKLAPCWRCSAAFLGFPGSSRRLQPLTRPSPVGMNAGTAQGTGMDSKEKPGARKIHAGNSRENRGIILFKECWWQILVVARPGSAPRGASWVHPCASHWDLSLEFRSLWQSQTCSKVWKWIKVSRGSLFLPHGDQLESGAPEAVPPWPNPKIHSLPWKTPFH